MIAVVHAGVGIFPLRWDFAVEVVVVSLLVVLMLVVMMMMMR